MGYRWNGPASESGSEAFGWNAGKAESELNSISAHNGRRILGVQNNAILAERRAEFLRDGNSDDQPANIQTPVPRQSGERADLPELCAQDRWGWQRPCRYASAGGPGTACHLHRMGAARRTAGQRWL